MVLPKMGVDRLDAYFAVVEREREEESAPRLEACITIGCSERSFESTAALSRADPRVFSAFGVHPLSAEQWKNAEAHVRALVQHEPRCVAIGECGLDYHRVPEDVDVEAYKERQRDAFAAQITLANELEKPLIVHTREAEEDTLAIMKAHLRVDAPVHVHCFTSSANLASALLDAFPNLCLGFTGVVTFKNGGDVRDVVAGVPLDRILLEGGAAGAARSMMTISSKMCSRLKQDESIARDGALDVFGFPRTSWTPLPDLARASPRHRSPRTQPVDASPRRRPIASSRPRAPFARAGAMRAAWTRGADVERDETRRCRPVAVVDRARRREKWGRDSVHRPRMRARGERVARSRARPRATREPSRANDAVVGVTHETSSFTALHASRARSRARRRRRMRTKQEFTTTTRASFHGRCADETRVSTMGTN